MTLEGDFEIITEGGSETVAMGETVLLPASLESVQLKPKSESVKILEVYIK
jgi:mannose-6-phosphate isomerase